MDAERRWWARALRGVTPTLLLGLTLGVAACQPQPRPARPDVGRRSDAPDGMRARPTPAMAATRPRPAPSPPARRSAAATGTPAALPLTLSLAVSTRALTMAQRARFQVRFTVVNQGPQTLDPQLHNVQLRVNGRPSIAWMLAIGNGPRDHRWRALPPGQSLHMGWALGKALFPGPGTYTLVLHQGTLRSSRLTVTVSP